MGSLEGKVELQPGETVLDFLDVADEVFFEVPGEGPLQPLSSRKGR